MFAIAVVMGAVTSKTNFCTMGAVSDWVNIGDTGRMRAWVFAMAVALAGVIALEATGIGQSLGRDLPAVPHRELRVDPLPPRRAACSASA